MSRIFWFDRDCANKIWIVSSASTFVLGSMNFILQKKISKMCELALFTIMYLCGRDCADAFCEICIKPNYFKDQHFSSSFLLTWSKYTGPKWPRSTWEASSMALRHGISPLSNMRNIAWKTLLHEITWL